MNSAFRAIWLVPQSRDIKYYSPPGGFRVKKMSRETHFNRKWSNFLGIAIKLVLYILKQLFASVSVTSGGYLPRRSGSVNIHRYSPPLLRIIVKHYQYFMGPVRISHEILFYIPHHTRGWEIWKLFYLAPDLLFSQLQVVLSSNVPVQCALNVSHLEARNSLLLKLYSRWVCCSCSCCCCRCRS